MIFRKYLIVAFATFFVALSSIAKDNKKVFIVSPWEITSYDPAVSGFVMQKLQIMENLVDANANGTLKPGLATSWSVSKDNLTWTFNLRKGVSFHDGTPFSAMAAYKALNRAWKKPGLLSKAPILKISKKGEDILITLKHPFAALPALLAHATTIIPSPNAKNNDGSPNAIIGTGPFKVAKFTPPQNIELIKNKSYWGAPAHIKKVSYLAVSRAETRALMAESGEADMVFTLAPSGFNHLKSINSIKAQSVPIPRVLVLKVNAAHEFMSSPKIRQALSLAINRKAISAAIMQFPDSAANQLFPPALGNWHNKGLKPLTYDVKKAKELLKSFGWKVGKDGVLVKNGKRFSIVMRTFPDRPELPLIAAAIQNQWKSIGVELKISVANYSRIPEGHKDGTLAVALYARNYSLSPDPIGTILHDFGKGGSDWGAMGWKNSTADSLFNKIAATNIKDIRSKSISKVTQILQQELPLIPILWYQHTVSIASKLKGVVIDPLQRSYGLSKVYWD